MVRGASSGGGKRSSVYYLAPGAPGQAQPHGPMLDFPVLGAPGLGDLRADDSPDPASGGTWAGAGGRWLLWPLRAVLWAALLVVVFRGVMAIAFDQASTPARSTVVTPKTVHETFPVSLAEAYAAEFGQVYLNASPASRAQREQALAAFVPASLAADHPDLGWNGIGELTLQSEQVAGISVQNATQAVVTLLAMVNGNVMELGVPVAASGGGVIVSGEPSWLPAPAQDTGSLPAAPVTSDQVAQSQLMNELPSFFEAYASGDTAAISRFTVKGSRVAGLGGNVTFDGITDLVVPSGGATRQIFVTVIWNMAGPAGEDVAKLEMPYRMSVVAQQSGQWYVKEIGASTEAVGGR